MTKKILIIGSGGREHALGWKLKQSQQQTQLFFAPGNGGTESIGKNIDISVEEIDALLNFAISERIDLTVVGPELPLSLGIVDVFQKAGLVIFGPTQKAARLESSKAWAGRFMQFHQIPTPQTKIFTDSNAAINFIETVDWQNPPYVIKADGLAAGKGVFLPKTKAEALSCISELMVEKKLGEAGTTVVFQEKLTGTEVSLLAITDGKTILPFITAQDYKRIGDGDTGPNTGGVGAIAPAQLSVDLELIHKTILLPTIMGMEKEGVPFSGILYAGLMITDQGPQVLEYNVRFGDPETQVLLPLLENDLYDLLGACTQRELDKTSLTFSTDYAVCTVLTAPGYPDNTKTGQIITQSEKPARGIELFHGGTKKEADGTLITTGGRVVGVVAQDTTQENARQRIYDCINQKTFEFEGMQYRTDIAQPKKMRVVSHAPVTRIEVFSKIADARATAKKQALSYLDIHEKIHSLAIADVYTIDKTLTTTQIEAITETLVNPVTQVTTQPNGASTYGRFSWLLEIGFLPGVTDNIGTTTQEIIEGALSIPFEAREHVYSSQLFFLEGQLSETDAQKIAAALSNPLIHRVHVTSWDDFVSGKKESIVPRVSLKKTEEVLDVDLSLSDEELRKLGKQGIVGSDGVRRGPLALDLEYLKTIQAYFAQKGRSPTDLELESIAQTWSEHCKHTIFADQVDDAVDGLFKTYIKRATEEIRKAKGENDFCASVFTDNSGAIIFDDEYLITHKVETHNSPSALDPFGGSITGIVGVNRDTIGFGLGAKPILNQYGFCLAPPRDTTQLFRDQKLTNELLSAKRIMDGVIAGVNSGGNCSGIPTPLGFLHFDTRFRAKPLVFVGTVGLIPQKIHDKLSTQKKASAGDLIVMIGGRVGIDGIHGATFSSESLNAGSPAGAVQIGDPITQKKLSDAIVNEARDLGLYTSITDNGAGGLSCSVAEMAKESGGCLVQLEKVPLKYPGLAPWQIWISESQERMTVSVPPEKWEALKALLTRHGVEATVIGEFTDLGKCEVVWHGKTIMDMDLEFLHNGLPKRTRTAAYTYTHHPEPVIPIKPDLSADLLAMLTRLNIGSTAFVSAQYDHDVQGNSVTKPLVGKGRVSADAVCIKPLPHSPKGVILSQSLYPRYSDNDTYHMAAASIDTAIRNTVVMGASLDTMALLDNFCWTRSNDLDRLGQLKRAVEACYDYATIYQTPFISGKDSMFNDFTGFAKDGTPISLSIPPTLLISSMAVVDDVTKVVTLDTKQVGDLIYILGDTNTELGSSEYYQYWGQTHESSAIGNSVPKVDAVKNKKLYEAYAKAVEKKLIASGISVGSGGLGVALFKMAIAGNLGADISLTQLPGDIKRNDDALFSESQGRILVSVAPKNQAAFQKSFATLSYAHVGTVTASEDISIIGLDNKLIARVTLTQAHEAYTKTFPAHESVHPVVVQKPKTLILTGYGINCEQETKTAFEIAGSSGQIAHLNDLIAKKYLLSDFDILAIPGGFSYGDDTGSGNAFAQKLKNHLWKEILEFVEKDNLVIGICNGFQVLVNLGLLPGLEQKYTNRSVALVHNESALYVARWVDVQTQNNSPWLKNITELSLPIAHGEGKLYAQTETLTQLKNNGHIALTYTAGEMAAEFNLPSNPTGSLENIAALSNASGTVLGLMPHPERALFFTQLPHWTRLAQEYERAGRPIPYYGPGLTIFQNAVAYVQKKHTQQTVAEVLTTSSTTGMTYAKSGVDVELGDDASHILYEAAKETWQNRDGKLGEIIEPFADFSGVRAINVANLPSETLMNISFDGVGSKMEIAERVNDFSTVAYDLLAMVCDDAVVRGAEPVLVGSILDVNSLGFNPEKSRLFLTQLAKGYVAAAERAGVAIINGEIAELGKRVGGYGDFAANWGAAVVWFAKKDRLFTGREIHPGEYIVGLKENGMRSNGFSLIRRVLETQHGTNWHLVPFAQRTLGEIVLTPSTIYAKAVVSMFGGFDQKPQAEVHGVAHITGGGLVGKIERMLKISGYGAIINTPFAPNALTLYLQEKGNITDSEAYKTWNMGQGMVIVTPSPEMVIAIAKSYGIDAQMIGQVTPSSDIVVKSQGYFQKDYNIIFPQKKYIPPHVSQSLAV